MTKDIPCRPDYTYEKFILYLFLCGAFADYQIEGSEKDMIRDKMLKSGLMKEENFDRYWNEVLNDFRNHNDLASMEHIEACSRDLHLDEVARLKVYKDLEDIMLADGEEEISERLNLFRLKKIMQL